MNLRLLGRGENEMRVTGSFTNILREDHSRKRKQQGQRKEEPEEHTCIEHARESKKVCVARME